MFRLILLPLLLFFLQLWHGLDTASAEIAESVNRRPAHQQLTFIEMTLPDSDNYILASERANLELGFDYAILDYFKKNPLCDISTRKISRSGTQEDFYNAVKALAVESGKIAGKNVIVGFPNSVMARLAAKAAQGSSLIGLSVGASTTELKSINPNFGSIGSPWTGLWQSIVSKMTELGCQPPNTFGAFNGADFYSRLFMLAFQNAGYLQIFSKTPPAADAATDALSKANCAILGLTLSASRDWLSTLVRKSWTGAVFGTGDWAYYPDEMHQFLASREEHREHLKNKLKLFVPTGWNKNANHKSKTFARRFRERFQRELPPSMAYSYDATLVALDYLCNRNSIFEMDPQKVRRLGLLRGYRTILPTGNYVSPHYLLELEIGQK